MKHPKLDENGDAVHLRKPHACTALSTWLDASALATAVPGCAMPPILNEIPFTVWTERVASEFGWESLTGSFEEPPLVPVPGLKRASGAVVLEADGRVWLVSPSNAFGGYVNTFPKGTLSKTEESNLRANAVREVWEETGLKVRLTAFLCDCKRSTSVTRYYLAQRQGGTPSDMGWETQAVHLLPRDQVAGFASHPNDQPIVDALQQNAR